MWFVYLLYSPSTGRTYTGIALKPQDRLAAHNGKGTRGAKATRCGRPWSIVLIEDYTDKGDALRREAAIKKLSRTEKLKLTKLPV
jgi:putative endonuclease